MLKFLLPDVTVRRAGKIRVIKDPHFSGENFLVNQREFSLFAEGIGNFYAFNGNEVEFAPVSGADPDWVDVYLNGQVLVALLHQRKIISLHASSFVYNGSGIMIFGESGAGKSSLTASFTLKGATLLTDDVTPLVFIRYVPNIMPLHGAIRIRRHTAAQLNIGEEKLRDAEAGTGKQYMHVENAGMKDFPLHWLLKIEVGEISKPLFDEPLPSEKFSFLRSEICMSEILAGMPDTEAAYLQQLVRIVEQVKFIRVVRPPEIEIAALHNAVSKYLAWGSRLK